MAELDRLLTALKRQLRQRGLTYRDVALALQLSEPSVKRLFSNGRFTIDRLIRLSALLGLTLAELTQQAAAGTPKLRTLGEAQEQELASDPVLLLVAVCALNHWSSADIVTSYRLTEAECLQRLLRLERMRLIDLLPGDRVRINVARDFDWRPDGPIRRLFREQGQDDFLAGDFQETGETFSFVHGMLTPAAAAQIQAQLQRLRRSFGDLHDECLGAAPEQRRGTGLLLALRKWEPPVFAQLRRNRTGPTASDRGSEW